MHALTSLSFSLLSLEAAATVFLRRVILRIHCTCTVPPHPVVPDCLVTLGIVNRSVLSLESTVGVIC